jgi:uncharacterized protein YjbI with pentapeptide repeats
MQTRRIIALITLGVFELNMVVAFAQVPPPAPKPPAQKPPATTQPNISIPVYPTTQSTTQTNPTVPAYQAQTAAVSGESMQNPAQVVIENGTQVVRTPFLLNRTPSGRNCVLTQAAKCDGLLLAGLRVAKTDLSRSVFNQSLLQGANFSESNLGQSRFQAADLRGAKFDKADLTNVNFGRAYLTDARFNDAVLIGADFSDSGSDDGAPPIFSRANLRGAQFTRATFRGIHLDGANLEKANFTGAKLAGANFAGANLVGVSFANADLTGVDFTRADLTAADLRGAVLTGAKLREAKFVKATLANQNFAGMDFKGSNFEEADLTGVNFTGANISAADLWGAVMTGAEFTNAIVTPDGMFCHAFAKLTGGAAGVVTQNNATTVVAGQTQVRVDSNSCTLAPPGTPVGATALVGVNQFVIGLDLANPAKKPPRLTAAQIAQQAAQQRITEILGKVPPPSGQRMVTVINMCTSRQSVAMKDAASVPYYEIGGAGVRDIYLNPTQSRQFAVPILAKEIYVNISLVPTNGAKVNAAGEVYLVGGPNGECIVSSDSAVYTNANIGVNGYKLLTVDNQCGRPFPVAVKTDLPGSGGIYHNWSSGLPDYMLMPGTSVQTMLFGPKFFLHASGLIGTGIAVPGSGKVTLTSNGVGGQAGGCNFRFDPSVPQQGSYRLSNLTSANPADIARNYARILEMYGLPSAAPTAAEAAVIAQFNGFVQGMRSAAASQAVQDYLRWLVNDSGNPDQDTSAPSDVVASAKAFLKNSSSAPVTSTAIGSNMRLEQLAQLCNTPPDDFKNSALAGIPGAVATSGTAAMLGGTLGALAGTGATVAISGAIANSIGATALSSSLLPFMGVDAGMVAAGAATTTTASTLTATGPLAIGMIAVLMIAVAATQVIKCATYYGDINTIAQSYQGSYDTRGAVLGDDAGRIMLLTYWTMYQSSRGGQTDAWRNAIQQTLTAQNPKMTEYLKTINALRNNRPQ